VKEARRLERFVQFATVRAREAIADAHLEINAQNCEKTAVVIGSGIGGAMSIVEQNKILETRGARRVSPFMVPMILVDTAPANVAIEFGIKGPNLAVVSAARRAATQLAKRRK